MSQPDQVILPPVNDLNILSSIDRLARRYINAHSLGIEIIDQVGDSTEQLIQHFPDSLRERINDVVASTLRQTFNVASTSHKIVRNRGDWSSRLGMTIVGAIGGATGITGALIELPVTITILMRAIVGIGEEHGFDIDSDDIKAEALQIFALGGPLSEDDRTDTALLTARLTVNGRSIQALISAFSPQIATRLLTKLGAQAVPVLGAFAGASINYTFARYYQEIARVQFGLMRLAYETNIPREALAEHLQNRIKILRREKASIRKA